ncbi:hypothetical protein P3X46_019072 [Hevea brasiliensis]|uniref:RING-type domain-containing protein n=1 Tax=Hevea brasiliensis TaxID=3981 RepID=A0ABQ9LTW8_HEVBR|nr:E3 ubiquitin-protein ligase RING1 [Hevea brasiliensis]KAJ9171018.1 hypothetical protein P3X46_019072 [Hevea brasiliensis]
MSRGFNNFNPPPTGDRRTGRDYGIYAPNNTDWNYPSLPMFPRLSPPQVPPGGSRGAPDDPWPHVEETLIPFHLIGFPMQPYSPTPFLVLNNGLAREPRPGIMEPRYFQASPSTQEDSRLTQDEQMKALKKLKKEIYNPVPKRISSRLCLYYRDRAEKILSERARDKEEDGKRCAVCLEDFEPKEMVMVTPCSHMFHEECIVPWVKSHGQCPVCRHALCDRIGGSAAGPSNNNNFHGLSPNDLIAILRAMGTM